MPEHSPHCSGNETRKALFQQVATLESGMAQMQALFLKERLQLYSKINSLSPIDQLPAEIKTEIFYNALLNDDTDDGRNSLINPFFLGKICQSWRDFVWSTPILWTNLHLRLSKDRCEAQTNLLRDWLSRTAGYPLSFRLTTAGSLVAWISDPPIKILTMLASVSAQWKEAEFFLPDTQDCFDAMSTAENSLPLLTTAIAHLDSVDSERQLTLFSTAPQLSTLHLYNPYMYNVIAPWHQLREFTSQACTVDEIREFLHKAPNIVRCSFKDIVSVILDESRDLDTFDRPPVVEHLEYLELWFDPDIPLDTTASQILGPAKLPSLREVSLRGLFSSSSAILPEIMTSFHASHLLQNFTFHGTIASDLDLIQLLENIPSIGELRLIFYEQLPNHPLLTKELLQRLFPSHAHTLLPNMRKFTYDGPTTLNNHLGVFRDALVYRFRHCTLPHTELDSEQRTVCQIQSVNVTSSNEFVISPDIEEELDNLVGEGLELSLTSGFGQLYTPNVL